MYYFAYGSNMNPDRMKERKVNYFQRKHAVLIGHRLEFNKVASRNPKEGYANIVPDKNGFVEGVLYDILDSDLLKLDEHEGYPNHYDRIILPVLTDNGQDIEAVTYIAQPDKIRKGLKPGKDYLGHLLAARDILSESYYKDMETIETLD